MMKKIFPFLLVLIFFSIPFAAARANITSNNYMITADSINFGGGYSSSTSYSIQDTMGESGAGNSSSTNYSMNAGYQQMYSSFISVGSLTPVSLSNISGLSGGAATGTLPISVLTDNPAGYSLTVQATSSPALESASGAYFSDYSSVSSTSPDYSFSVGSSSSVFGFSVQSTDATSQYHNNGSICNSGSFTTAFTCWDNFTTSPKIIAQSSGPNNPVATVTTLDLEAQVGAMKIQDSGTYSATITVTAVAL